MKRKFNEICRPARENILDDSSHIYSKHAAVREATFIRHSGSNATCQKPFLNESSRPSQSFGSIYIPPQQPIKRNKKMHDISTDYFSSYILASIFEFLTPKDIILTTSSVSRYWYEVSRNARMWQKFENYDFFSSKLRQDDLSCLARLFRELFVDNAIQKYEHFPMKL